MTNSEYLEQELLEGLDQEIIGDLDVMMRSRSLIIQIISSEESRVIHRLRQLAEMRNRKIVFWTCASGVFTYNESNEREPYPLMVQNKPWGTNRTTTDPLTILDYIQVDDKLNEPEEIEDIKNGISQKVLVGGGAIYVLLDLPNFMPSSQGGGQMSMGEIEIVRKLKDLREILNEGSDRKTVIIVSRDAFVPEDLKKIIPILDWPLPNKAVILKQLKKLSKDVEEVYAASNINKKFSEKDLNLLSDSLLGLTIDEVSSTFQQSAVKNASDSSIENFIKYNLKAKKDIIRKSRSGLEFYDTKINIKDNVGGLPELKKWLKKRARAYSDEAQKYGIEYPKGILLVGIPGNGKSLIAKAIANDWNQLLLRWDVGSTYKSRVGESEEGVRQVIKTAEAVAPCILWIDEIEKGFAGIGSSDKSDAGTSARVFSTFLQYMSEKSSPVFIVATANRIDQLPAELVRSGRFDVIFYIDTPTDIEREEIIKIHLRQRKLKENNFDIAEIVKATENFTGSEVEETIKKAMLTAFSEDSRETTTNDILEEANDTIPLVKQMAEQIEVTREWAMTRAKWASGRKITKEELERTLSKKRLVGNNLEILPSGKLQGPDLGDTPPKEDE